MESAIWGVFGVIFGSIVGAFVTPSIIAKWNRRQWLMQERLIAYSQFFTLANERLDRAFRVLADNPNGISSDALLKDAESPVQIEHVVQKCLLLEPQEQIRSELKNLRASLGGLAAVMCLFRAGSIEFNNVNTMTQSARSNLDKFMELIANKHFRQ